MTHRAGGGTFSDTNREYTGPTIRGQNPVLLVDKPVRERIFDSYFWREQCFGLNAATLLDRAVEITSVGGTYAAGKASPFLCLLFKLLQLAPEKPIVDFLLNEGGDDFKYLRVLAAMYVRLTYSNAEVYKTLEPHLADYRRLRKRTKTGWSITTVDQFIDDLLVKERVCAVTLWKLPERTQLEDLELLDERVSPLGDEVDELDGSDIEAAAATASDAASSADSSEDELEELKPEDVETKPENEDDK